MYGQQPMVQQGFAKLFGMCDPVPTQGFDRGFDRMQVPRRLALDDDPTLFGLNGPIIVPPLAAQADMQRSGHMNTWATRPASQDTCASARPPWLPTYGTPGGISGGSLGTPVPQHGHPRAPSHEAPRLHDSSPGLKPPARLSSSPAIPGGLHDSGPAHYRRAQSPPHQAHVQPPQTHREPSGGPRGRIMSPAPPMPGLPSSASADCLATARYRGYEPITTPQRPLPRTQSCQHPGFLQPGGGLDERFGAYGQLQTARAHSASSLAVPCLQAPQVLGGRFGPPSVFQAPTTPYPIQSVPPVVTVPTTPPHPQPAARSPSTRRSPRCRSQSPPATAPAPVVDHNAMCVSLSPRAICTTATALPTSLPTAPPGGMLAGAFLGRMPSADIEVAETVTLPPSARIREDVMKQVLDRHIREQDSRWQDIENWKSAVVQQMSVAAQQPVQTLAPADTVAPQPVPTPAPADNLDGTAPADNLDGTASCMPTAVIEVFPGSSPGPFEPQEARLRELEDQLAQERASHEKTKHELATMSDRYTGAGDHLRELEDQLAQERAISGTKGTQELEDENEALRNNCKRMERQAERYVQELSEVRQELRDARSELDSNRDAVGRLETSAVRLEAERQEAHSKAEADARRRYQADLEKAQHGHLQETGDLRRALQEQKKLNQDATVKVQELDGQMRQLRAAPPLMLPADYLKVVKAQATGGESFQTENARLTVLLSRREGELDAAVRKLEALSAN